MRLRSPASASAARADSASSGSTGGGRASLVVTIGAVASDLESAMGAASAGAGLVRVERVDQVLGVELEGLGVVEPGERCDPHALEPRARPGRGDGCHRHRGATRAAAATGAHQPP